MPTHIIDDHLRKFCVEQRNTLLEAAEVIQNNKMRAALVVNEGKVLGVISEGDILRALLNDTSMHAPIDDVMRLSFSYLEKRDLQQALPLFQRHLFGVLPIVSSHMELLDVITLSDIMTYLSQLKAAK